MHMDTDLRRQCLTDRRNTQHTPALPAAPHSGTQPHTLFIYFVFV